MTCVVPLRRIREFLRVCELHFSLSRDLRLPFNQHILVFQNLRAAPIRRFFVFMGLDVLMPSLKTVKNALIFVFFSLVIGRICFMGTSIHEFISRLPPFFNDLIHLNAISGDIDCPSMLHLRTRNSLSRSFNNMYLDRLRAGGDLCFKSLYPHGDILPLSNERLSSKNINQFYFENYHNFAAFMNYTPELRYLIDVNRLYRITSIEKPRSHIRGLLSSEKYASQATIRPMLEGLGTPLYGKTDGVFETLPKSLTTQEIDFQIDQVLRNFHLVMVRELWGKSLAVLMFDCEWRLVDLLAPTLLPKLNYHRNNNRSEYMGPKLKEHIEWVMNVDKRLYNVISENILQRFQALPRMFRKIPEAIQTLQLVLEKDCPDMEDLKCILRFRSKILSLGGIATPHV